MMCYNSVTADVCRRSKFTRHMLLNDWLNPETLQSGNMTSHITKRLVNSDLKAKEIIVPSYYDISLHKFFQFRYFVLNI